MGKRSVVLLAVAAVLTAGVALAEAKQDPIRDGPGPAAAAPTPAPPAAPAGPQHGARAAATDVAAPPREAPPRGDEAAPRAARDDARAASEPARRHAAAPADTRPATASQPSHATRAHARDTPEANEAKAAEAPKEPAEPKHSKEPRTPQEPKEPKEPKAPEQPAQGRAGEGKAAAGWGSQPGTTQRGPQRGGPAQARETDAPPAPPTAEGPAAVMRAPEPTLQRRAAGGTSAPAPTETRKALPPPEAPPPAAMGLPQAEPVLPPSQSEGAASAAPGSGRRGAARRDDDDQPGPSEPQASDAPPFGDPLAQAAQALRARLAEALGAAAAWLAGFRRVGPGNLLEHPARRQLLALVRRRPGVHLRAAARHMGLAVPSAAHHLRLLERHGLLRAERLGGKLAFFPAAGPEDHRRLVAEALLESGARAAVLRALAHHPGSNQLGLAALTHRHQGAVAWHLRRLAAAGLVEERRLPRECRYRLTPLGDELAAPGPSPETPWARGEPVTV